LNLNLNLFISHVIIIISVRFLMITITFLKSYINHIVLVLPNISMPFPKIMKSKLFFKSSLIHRPNVTENMWIQNFKHWHEPFSYLGLYFGTIAKLRDFITLVLSSIIYVKDVGLVKVITMVITLNNEDHLEFIRCVLWYKKVVQKVACHCKVNQICVEELFFFH
jgi:hypothetical protein